MENESGKRLRRLNVLFPALVDALKERGLSLGAMEQLIGAAYLARGAISYAYGHVIDYRFATHIQKT